MITKILSSLVITDYPHSWSDFPVDCMWYFVVMGVLHLAIFVVGVLVIAALAIKQRRDFIKRVGRFGLFMGLLLIVGSVINGVWSCAIWGRLYFSTDYIFDFSPFWPITQKLIDARFGDKQGQLIGVSIFQLQLIWLLFAITTWAATIISYRYICRQTQANMSSLPTGMNPTTSIPTALP